MGAHGLLLNEDVLLLECAGYNSRMEEEGELKLVNQHVNSIVCRLVSVEIGASQQDGFSMAAAKALRHNQYWQNQYEHFHHKASPQ